MKNRNRMVFGAITMVIGLCMIVFAARTAAEPGASSPAQVGVAAVSAVGGGVLAFGVARRLLSFAEPRKERAEGEPQG